MSHLVTAFAIVLFALSGLAFLAGVYVLLRSQSAVHEIEAFIILNISSIFLIGAVITFSINWLAKLQRGQKD
ncbi:MAG: hypothetical protein CMI30_03665 [Opitutae bacterium]|nr:hypothetical protein [Opitutae bacterium]|tara:strand:- start:536 stop:751 length:216 start_codon:yes stop_codon:yes gene_type:complete